MCECVKGKLQQCFNNLLIKCIIYPGHSLIDFNHNKIVYKKNKSGTSTYQRDRVSLQLGPWYLWVKAEQRVSFAALHATQN